MKAMILAAGRGERMRPLTDTCPKPLLWVAGKPLIAHHIEKLVAAGVDDIIVNAAWLSERLIDYLGDGSRFGVRIHVSCEHQALETAGGIRQALPLLGDRPFILVNGDVWTDYLFGDLPPTLANNVLAHLVLVPNPQHHPSGDFALSGRGMLDLHASPRYTYAGLALMSPRLFAGLPEGRAPLAPLLRAQSDQVSGEVFRGRWCDVGTPERLAQLDARLANEPNQEPV